MSDKPAEKQEDWMQKKWRPAMGWMYMVVCVFDFILFPVLWAVIQFWETQAANDAFRQWSPLTLQGAGLFHMAMGAVLGIAAWSRGQEKMAGMNVPTPPLNQNLPISPVSSTPPKPYIPPAPAAPQVTKRPPPADEPAL